MIIEDNVIRHEVERLMSIKRNDADVIKKALAKLELLNDIEAIDFDEYIDIKDMIEGLGTKQSSKGYSVKMTADALGITDRTVRQWIRDGKIKATKIQGTRRWLICADEIERLRGDNI